MAPSADCADAIPFHCESGLARMTAKEASLEAAIAMAFAISASVMPSSRPAAALCREGELRGVIEAAGHEVAVVDQAGLDGVTERHAEHQVAAASLGQLRGRQRDAEVVRRVARLGRRQEVVHEVHITNEDGVPERGVHRIGLAAADQRQPVTTAEIPDLVAAGADRAGSEGRDGARQAVEDVDVKLLA